MQRVSVTKVGHPRVLSWHFEPGDLVVRFEGHAGDSCPICVCGRGHWFAHSEKDPSGRERLHLFCHNCGHRFEFDLA